MIGFVIKSGKCNVIPELSLYDTTHDLYEILNNIPYSQSTCCFCLNSFLNSENIKTDYNKDTDGLNMDWFKSRIIILKCNHIFHLCCFTKYIKHNYNEYIFANVEIDIVNESENNSLSSSLSSLCSSENNDLNSRLSNSLYSSENKIKTIESKTSNCSSENNIKSEILSDLYDNLEENTNNKIIWKKFLKKIIDKEISDYCNGENISNNSYIESNIIKNKEIIFNRNKILSDNSYDNALRDIKIYHDFLVNNNKSNDNKSNDNKSNDNKSNDSKTNSNSNCSSKHENFKKFNDNNSNDNNSNDNNSNDNNVIASNSNDNNESNKIKWKNLLREIIHKKINDFKINNCEQNSNDNNSNNNNVIDNNVIDNNVIDNNVIDNNVIKNKDIIWNRNKNLTEKSYNNDINIYYDHLVNLRHIINSSESNEIKSNERILSEINSDVNEIKSNERISSEIKSDVNEIKSNVNKSNELNELDNIKSYYETENSINTSINSNCFRVECPLCKKKVNSFCTSSILEKYKILLELYS